MNADRAKFARLTSNQREAIYELCQHHSPERVLEILSQPSPVGMNFHTSRAGLYRFCADYKQLLFKQQSLASRERAEQERVAAEQAFQNANTSDESFRQTTERQIRKRLFHAAQNPNSDFHEIRWLLKSLETLRKSMNTP